MFEPVEVWWHDSTRYEGWTDRRDAARTKLLTIRTLGYLLAKDALQTSLVRSVGDEGDIEGLFIIPNGCIVKENYFGEI